MAVWLVADFEALSCQVTTAFDTSCAARIPTAPAINYTACCMLVFIIQIQLVTSFCKSNILSNQSALTLQRSTNLFFFVGGKIAKPPIKAVTRAGFVSSLASFGCSVGSWGLAMC
jgi:hypothetical protein